MMDHKFKGVITDNLPEEEEQVSELLWLLDLPRQQHQNIHLPLWDESSQHCQQTANQRENQANKTYLRSSCFLQKEKQTKKL